jgi:hypothetical protein
VDTRGYVDIAFFDRRDNPATKKYHLYRARSTNGGQSFGANITVTDVVSNADNSGYTSPQAPFIGDYMGFVSYHGLHPYWTDVRGSNAEGFTLRPPGVAAVTGSSMHGWAVSGDYPGEMTLRFNFTTVNEATEFKVRYRVVNTQPWTTADCKVPSGSWSIFGPGNICEAATLYSPCDETKFEWQASGYNCSGWSSWSASKTFTAYCIE